MHRGQLACLLSSCSLPTATESLSAPPSPVQPHNSFGLPASQPASAQEYRSVSSSPVNSSLFTPPQFAPHAAGDRGGEAAMPRLANRTHQQLSTDLGASAGQPMNASNPPMQDFDWTHRTAAAAAPTAAAVPAKQHHQTHPCRGPAPGINWADIVKALQSQQQAQEHLQQQLQAREQQRQRHQPQERLQGRPQPNRTCLQRRRLSKEVADRRSAPHISRFVALRSAEGAASSSSPDCATAATGTAETAASAATHVDTAGQVGDMPSSLSTPKLPLLSREYAKLAVSTVSRSDSPVAAPKGAATAEQLHVLMSISSTRPLVSGDYVPLGGHSPGGGAEGSGLLTEDEQVQPQLLPGELSLIGVAAGGVHAGLHRWEWHPTA